MAADQERNCLAVSLIEGQPRHALLRNLKAGDDVALTRHAFANVVQQQTEIKKFGAFEFLEEAAVALVPLGLRLLCPMKALDGEKRMLIDGEAMIEVPYHQRIDEFEFRQEQDQQAERMHGSQSLGGMRLDQYSLQIAPAQRAGWRRLRQFGQHRLNP